MQSKVMKSFVICAFGAALMAGCASSHSPSSSSMQASSQGNMQSGKVVAVERAAMINQSGMSSSSGYGAGGTTASVEPTIVTVQFADGSQGRYSMDRSALAVGDTVSVISDGDRITILSR